MTNDYFYGDDLLTTPRGFRDEFKEYVFRADFTPAGAGGQPLRGIPMLTESDADFIARAVRGTTVCLSVAAGTVTAGGDVAIRWTNSEGRYMQSAPARLVTLVGTSTNPAKLAPAMIIPAGATILFDVLPIDTNFVSPSRCYVVFVGVKRYRLEGGRV